MWMVKLTSQLLIPEAVAGTDESQLLSLVSAVVVVVVRRQRATVQELEIKGLRLIEEALPPFRFGPLWLENTSAGVG